MGHVACLIFIHGVASLSMQRATPLMTRGMTRLDPWMMKNTLKPSVGKGRASGVGSHERSSQRSKRTKWWNGDAAILLRYPRQEDVLEDIKGTGHWRMNLRVTTFKAP